jgi:hypothetical protein
MQSYCMYFYILVGALGVGALLWNVARSQAMLSRWAAENDYQILDSNYRLFCRGPFFWNSSKSQSVFRVTILDRQGHTHTGWVRCGSWVLGLWSEQTEVRWDD